MSPNPSINKEEYYVEAAADILYLISIDFCLTFCGFGEGNLSCCFYGLFGKEPKSPEAHHGGYSESRGIQRRPHPKFY